MVAIRPVISKPSSPFINLFVTVPRASITFKSFSHQRSLIVFRWSLSDSMSPQVSRTLPSILADLNNTVIWMVSICPLISKFSIPFTNPMGIVPSVLITVGITVTFMFPSFLIYYCYYLANFAPLLKSAKVPLE